MPSPSIQAMTEQLKAIRQELSNATPAGTTGSSEGAAWLRVRMLKRAADGLERAINELECYQRSDEDVNAFGRNLKTLDENSD
jgi:hypothetical protein